MLLLPCSLLCGQSQKVIRGDYLRSTDTGAHCGVYAIAAAARTIGVECDPAKLLTPEFVGDRDGSTASELVLAAKSLGLDAVPCEGLNTFCLKNSSGPVLLFLAENFAVEGSKHWVCYLGDKNGKAQIFDAGFGLRDVSYASLLAQWSGQGVVVTNKPNSIWDYLFLGRAVSLGYVIMAFMLLFLGKRGIEQAKCPRSKVARFFVLLVLPVSVGILYHSFSEVGFWGNREVLKLISISSNFGKAIELPEITAEEIMTGSLAEPVLIDVRIPKDFASGSIPGAINLPMDASFWDKLEVISNIEKSEHIVVFCQSKQCKWAEIIGRFLSDSGFRNIRVFRGGWVEWRQKKNSGE